MKLKTMAEHQREADSAALAPFWPEESCEDFYKESWCGVVLQRESVENRVEEASMWLVPMSEVMPTNPTRYQLSSMAVDESARALGFFVCRALQISEWSELEDVELNDQPPTLEEIRAVDLHGDETVQLSRVSVGCENSAGTWREMVAWVEKGLSESFSNLSPAVSLSPIDILQGGPAFKRKVKDAVGEAMAWREALELRQSLSGAARVVKKKKTEPL